MRWDTLFLTAQNENLMKDVGLIPYFMMKEFGLDANIVSYDNDELLYLNKEVKGLKHITVKNKGKLVSSIKYLAMNAKKIDFLNLYHWGRVTLICVKLYKFLNKTGKVYVKLDMDLNGIRVIRESERDRKVLGRILNSVDLVTVESRRIYDELHSIYGQKIEYLPNGLFYTDIECNKPKKKQILTVGRLGTEQKATEILLQAFASIADEIPEWNLVLVGGVEPEFKEYLTKFQNDNQGIADRITFTGKITDKNILNAYYAESKIFALPSRWESFALVLLEAMTSGCYIVSTDGVAPIHDLISNDSYGLIAKIDDINDFADKLKTACINDSYQADKISNFAVNNFSWRNICDELGRKLGLGGRHE